MRIAAVLIVTFALLSGCAVVNHDRTDAPGMEALVGKRFVIQQDSFLLEGYCKTQYITKTCLFMQIAGGFIQGSTSGPIPAIVRRDLPKTLDDYAKDPGKVNDSLVSYGLFTHTRHDIVATVPKGTIIMVTRVVEAALGESGSGWLLYGTIQSEPGISIQIGPAQLSGTSYPSWLKNANPISGGIPQLSPDFLRPAPP